MEEVGDPEVAGERPGQTREDRNHVSQGPRDPEVRGEAHSHRQVVVVVDFYKLKFLLVSDKFNFVSSMQCI